MRGLGDSVAAPLLDAHALRWLQNEVSGRSSCNTSRSVAVVDDAGGESVELDRRIGESSSSAAVDASLDPQVQESENGRGATSCVIDESSWGYEGSIAAVSNGIVHICIIFALCRFSGIQAPVTVVTFRIRILDGNLIDCHIQSGRDGLERSLLVVNISFEIK